MDLTSFYIADSKWIDSIDRDVNEWGGYTIVSVIYSDKKAKAPTTYDCFFWVPVEKYEALINAPSQGSEYYYNWSVYGTPETRYNNQDFGTQPDDVNKETARGSKKGDRVYLDDKAYNLSPTSISAEDYEDAMRSKMNGDFDEWLFQHTGEFDEDERDELSEFLGHLENADDLYKRTMEMRMLIKTEQLTGKQMFKMIFRDIEEMLGISLQSKIKFQVLQGIDVGVLSPQKMKSYSMKIKNIYSAIDSDGIRGAGQIGQRFANSKNPLVRNRYAYKGKEVLKSMAKKPTFFTGNEAVIEIQKFHNKVLKEEAKGIMKKNNMYLEKSILKDGTEAYAWKKEITFGRRIIQSTKKVLRLAKWFIFF